MRSRNLYPTTLLGFLVSAAVAVAPVAGAVPECTNTGPNTTQCQSNGNAQIVTSPPPNNNYGYWGYPLISIGGWGIGW